MQSFENRDDRVSVAWLAEWLFSSFPKKTTWRSGPRILEAQWLAKATALRFNSQQERRTIVANCKNNSFGGAL
jgi:hypothetical protein